MYIQIGAMERDVHGALGGLGPPPSDGAEAAGPRAPLARKSRLSPVDYTVIVDLPHPLPITEAEVELLESELADFIAELLKK